MLISIQLYSALGKNCSECGADCQQSTCGVNSVYDQYMSAGRKIMENSLSTDGFDVITKTILLNETDPDATRASILKYFHDTYDTFSSLYETVKEENFWMVGDTLRHPVGWYVGHTTGFYVNKLRISGVIAKPVNEQFEAMFAVGVDEMSWDDKLEPRDDWPSVKSVKKYRSDVRKIVSDIIQV